MALDTKESTEVFTVEQWMLEVLDKLDRGDMANTAAWVKAPSLAESKAAHPSSH